MLRSTHGPRLAVRAWRLRESAAVGFKSANKHALGFYPRYTRLLTRPVLVTHTLRPFPLEAAHPLSCRARFPLGYAALPASIGIACMPRCTLLEGLVGTLSISGRRIQLKRLVYRQ